MSCHRAEVEGYIVDAHISAEDAKRLLAERPEARGLAVLGMPARIPGMAMGDMRAPHDTLIDRDGKVRVFASHG